MYMEVFVHQRIHEKHPELEDEDVESAFNNAFAEVRRFDKDVEEFMAIGSDSKGRLVEIVYRTDFEGNIIIFHAFTPPTNKALTELGLMGRHKNG